MPVKSDKQLQLFSVWADADWSLGFSLNGPLLLVILGLIFVIGMIVQWFRSSSTSGQMVIDQAEIGIGDSKLIFKPNVSDQQVAYAIWVELSTRKIGLEIDFDHDVISEIYDSWYQYFSVTRELIKEVSVTQIRNTSTRAIINLSIDVLNKGLRPHLTKWQGRYRWWLERELRRCDERDYPDPVIDLQQLQQRFPQYNELKEEMEQVNRSLIAYRLKMEQLVFSIGKQPKS